MSVADILLAVAAKIKARLTSINTALVAKGQTEATTLYDVPAKIAAIETGADVSGVTATASDVLDTAKFVDENGDLLDGAIKTQSTDSISLSGATITVPKGYYAKATEKTFNTETWTVTYTDSTSTSTITVVVE